MVVAVVAVECSRLRDTKPAPRGFGYTTARRELRSTLHVARGACCPLYLYRSGVSATVRRCCCRTPARCSHPTRRCRVTAKLVSLSVEWPLILLGRHYWANCYCHVHRGDVGCLPIERFLKPSVIFFLFLSSSFLSFLTSFLDLSYSLGVMIDMAYCFVYGSYWSKGRWRLWLFHFLKSFFVFNCSFYLLIVIFIINEDYA